MGEPTRSVLHGTASVRVRAQAHLLASQALHTPQSLYVRPRRYCCNALIDGAAARRPFPSCTYSGFKNDTGKPIATALPGATVTVELTTNNGTGAATVTDEAGTTANVVAPNFFLMATTLHGIDKVLSPKPAAAAATAKPAAAKPAAAKPAAVPASGMRKLLQRSSSGETQVSQILGNMNSQDAVRAAVSSSSKGAEPLE
jgi:hypothetical protein